MAHQAANYETLNDTQLASFAASRDARAVSLITTRYNQRLFRTAWSVLRNHAEAEEVVQEAYIKAFKSMQKFEGTSSLSTWLTRIVLNASIDRKRALQRRREALESNDVAFIDFYRAHYASDGDLNLPHDKLEQKQLSEYVKVAIGRLADEQRTVFVLRDVERLSIAETAAILNLSTPAIKSRLFRARRLLRKDIEARFGDVFEDAIPFAGVDCEALTAKIIKAFCSENVENEK